MDIYDSARKHAISDEDIRHGVEHALVAADEHDTGKVLYLGSDRAGNLLEIVTVLRYDGTEIGDSRDEDETNLRAAAG